MWSDLMTCMHKPNEILCMEECRTTAHDITGSDLLLLLSLGWAFSIILKTVFLQNQMYYSTFLLCFFEQKKKKIILNKQHSYAFKLNMWSDVHIFFNISWRFFDLFSCIMSFFFIVFCLITGGYGGAVTWGIDIC